MKKEFKELKIYCCMDFDCGNYYTTRSNLKHHIDVCHLKTKKFTCRICFQKLASKQNLREHINKHRGIKPFLCGICKIAYRQRSQVIIHSRIHDEPLKIIENTKESHPEKRYKKLFDKNAEKKNNKNSTFVLLPPIGSHSSKDFTLPSFASLMKKH